MTTIATINGIRALVLAMLAVYAYARAMRRGRP